MPTRLQFHPPFTSVFECDSSINFIHLEKSQILDKHKVFKHMPRYISIISEVSIPLGSDIPRYTDQKHLQNKKDHIF